MRTSSSSSKGETGERRGSRQEGELGSVRLLKEELEACGIKSKSWTSASSRLRGGKPFSRGALYLMLQNRIYRGEIADKGQSRNLAYLPGTDGYCSASPASDFRAAASPATRPVIFH
jgi:hypothetical protein